MSDDDVILGLQRRILGLEHDLGAARISNKLYNERICRLTSYVRQIQAGTVQFDAQVLDDLVISYKYSGWSFIAK